jgi:hypothetical protein
MAALPIRGHRTNFLENIWAMDEDGVCYPRYATVTLLKRVKDRMETPLVQQNPSSDFYDAVRLSTVQRRRYLRPAIIFSWNRCVKVGIVKF